VRRLGFGIPRLASFGFLRGDGFLFEQLGRATGFAFEIVESHLCLGQFGRPAVKLGLLPTRIDHK
jgi:hypothetical protein